MMDNRKTQAVLWMDTGVLYRRPNKAFEQMPEALAYLAAQGVRMAVVSADDAQIARKNIASAGLPDCFEKDAADQPLVFSAAVYTQRKPGDDGANATTMNTSLTQAFLAARVTLGTDRQRTLAIVDSVHNVRNARYAGLPVIGMTAACQNPLTIGDVQARMVDYGAFYAASAAIDLPSAVMHFRPPYEAKWQLVAAPGG